MTGESAVRIAVLLPDVLGTYSDAGNAVVLAQRLRWRGMRAEIVAVPAESTPPTACDVFVLGGGEDAAQLYAADWLRQHHALRLAMQLTQVVAVCAGLQVLGRWMQGAGGRRYPGAELLDVTTTPAATRAVGEMLSSSTDATTGILTGFENHRGHTIRGPGLLHWPPSSAARATATAPTGCLPPPSSGPTCTGRCWHATRAWPTWCCVGSPD